jgi:hypothetical protein
MRQIGQLFLLRMNINLVGNVLDSPVSYGCHFGIACLHADEPAYLSTCATAVSHVPFTPAFLLLYWPRALYCGDTRTLGVVLGTYFTCYTFAIQEDGIDAFSLPGPSGVFALILYWT